MYAPASSIHQCMDIDMDSSELLFDGFELSTPLDSNALALAAHDLANPNAFFEFATLDAAAIDSLACVSAAAPTARIDADAAAFEPESDDTASLSSFLSHCTDSDSSGSTSDSAGSSPVAIKQQQSPKPLQPIAPPTQRKSVAKATSRSSKKVRATQSHIAPLATVANATNAAPPTKRPRKHNRIEILKLREQVETLQCRVAELQLIGDGDGRLGGSVHVASRTTVSAAVAAQYARQLSTSSNSATQSTALSATAAAMPRSVWLDVAVEQYATLQHAQTLNRKLRDAVATQRAAIVAFESLLHKSSSRLPSNLLRELLLTPPSTECMTRCALDATLPSLLASVTAQFCDTDAVLHSIRAANDPATVFHSSRTRQDVRNGGAPAFELMTNTPVAKSQFRALALSLWRHIVVVKAPLEAAADGVSHIKRTEMTLATSDGPLELLGCMVVRKFEQPKRVVLAVASTYCVRGSSNLVFRDRAWVVVSDAHVGADAPRPAAASLFQTFYALGCEQMDVESDTGSLPFTDVVDPETRKLQRRVVQALGDRMREHKLEMQRGLQISVAKAFSHCAIDEIEQLECPLVEARC